MKKLFFAAIAFMFMLGMSQLALAAEHGGKEHGGKTHAQEHGGKEHGGAAQVQEEGGTMAKIPSSDEIRAAMKNHVLANYTAGAFNVNDPETGNVRKLQLVRVHERVGKTGDYYYSCADFKDIESDELLDLDLDVEDQDGTLKVVDVRIHKLNGVERYTYDENDSRIPLGEKEMEKKETQSMDAPAAKEHGGKEHGGAGM